MFFWYLDYLLTLNCFIWGPEACVKIWNRQQDWCTYQLTETGVAHTKPVELQARQNSSKEDGKWTWVPHLIKKLFAIARKGGNQFCPGECYWLCQPYPRSDPLLVASLAKRSSAMAGLLVHLPLLFWDLCLGWSHTVPGRVSTTTVRSFVQLPCCVLETLSWLVTCCFWSWEPFCLCLCDDPWALGRRSVM